MKKICIIIIILSITPLLNAYNDLYSNPDDVFSCVCNDGVQVTQRPYSADMTAHDARLIDYCNRFVCQAHGGVKATFKQGPTFRNDAAQDTDCFNGNLYAVPTVPNFVFPYDRDLHVFECPNTYSRIPGQNNFFLDWKNCLVTKAYYDGKTCPPPAAAGQGDEDDFQYT